MKKALFLLFLVMAFSCSSFATHFAGGEIYYNWNGVNYTVTLKLYTPCLPNIAGMPDSNKVIVKSNSKSVFNTIYIKKIKVEEITPQCSVLNSCANPNSQLPSYKVYTYQDTVSLADTASDWVFYWWSGARSVTSNMTSGNVYFEATLDNTGGNNSIAYTPTTLPIVTNMAGVKVDLQTLDYDGDSIVIETSVPMEDTVNSATYVNLYSGTSPLGVGVTYRVNGNTLEMGANPNQGFYGLAYKVKEYRKGKLIGTHTRDFIVGYMGSAATVTRPALAYGITEMYVCPGKTQSFKLGFTDTLTDSVYVTIDTPTIGWPIQATIRNGLGNASIDVQFIAPTTLNPQTLPFFYINVLVYDDACPRNATKYAVLVKTRVCDVDSVWPGDANYDNVVNLLDPLAIALSYGRTGSTRAGASTAWVPQYSVNWGTNIPFTVIDNKHADCNGDGTVNVADLGAIASNWSKTHNKGGAQQKTSAAVELYFDLSGISFVPGAQVDVPIKIRGLSINNFYGLSSEVGMTLNAALPTAQVAVAPSTAWLGNTSNTIEFNKVLDKGTIAWAYARNNQLGVSGNGTVGTLSFEIPSNAQDGDRIDMTFRSTTLIDATGRVLNDYTAIDAVAFIWPVNVSGVANAISGMVIVPNPSQNNASLQLTLNKEEKVMLVVTDVTGKNIWSASSVYKKGQNQILLPASEIAAGMYMIQVKTADGYSQTLKWVKQ